MTTPNIEITQRARQHGPELDNPMEWIVARDTGISSRTIWAVMVDVRTSVVPRTDIPHDPPDFGRCYRLLEHFPHWRKKLGLVAQELPRWGPFVDNWDDLEEMYEACLNPHGHYRGGTDASRAMYERMQELIPQ